MNTIIINGKTIMTAGRNICITNGSVMVDGQAVQDGLSGIVEIKFEGDLASLNVKQGSATITGAVQGDVDAGGSVHCGDVHKNVDAGGSVHCGNVIGNIDAGGSVTCGNVSGDIDAGGSVTHRK